MPSPRLQFTLRAVLVLTTLAASVLGMWRITFDRAKLQLAIIEQLRNSGGDVYRDRDGRVVHIFAFRLRDSNTASWELLTDLERISSFDADCTDADIKAIANCRSLRELELDGGSYSESGLGALGRLAMLRTLSLKNVYLTAPEVDALAAAPQLITLNIGLKESAVQALATKPFLNNLQVMEVYLKADNTNDKVVNTQKRVLKLDLLTIRGGTSVGLDQLLGLVQRAAVVELHGCELSPSVIVKLAKIDGLKRLAIMECAIPPDSFESSAKFAQLESLALSGRNADETLLVNLNAPQLRQVNLNGTGHVRTSGE